MATPDAGLVTAAYAPSRVHTKLAGVDVTVEEQTEYPFRGKAEFTIHAARPLEFPLLIRVPLWANAATLSLNGKISQIPASGCTLGTPESGTNQGACDLSKAFYRIRRTWKEGDRMAVEFAPQPRVTHWYHNAAVFEWGPLVFSLPLDGEWSELKHYAQKSGDWQITPSKEWNYAVEIGDCAAKVVEAPLSLVPFDRTNPAVKLEVKGRRDPQWVIEENSAGPVPGSPVPSTEPLQTLILIPYGAAKLRITEFPYLQEKSECPSATAGAQNSR